MDVVLALIAAPLVLATGLALSRQQVWWVRVFDFPRLQIAIGLLLVLLAHLVLVPHGTGAWLLRGLLAACLTLQGLRMRPYTWLARRQVQDSRRADPATSLRLLFANVLQDNRDAAALHARVQQADPDVFLALEADAWWAAQLEPLARRYPFVVRQAQDNTYGMLLFSRLPLVDAQVRFLVEPDVPSIHARVRLRGGTLVQLHCLHPRPPAPGEADSSATRDAELLIVGRGIRQDQGPVVVLGDMNDVAWSHTSSLFRRISGLLDPRIGRGFFNTFHAGHWLIRYPLDHFFHSNDFRLVSFRRLPFFGSDHFPVFIHLSHEPDAAPAQPEPQPDGADVQESREKIAEVAPQAAPRAPAAHG